MERYDRYYDRFEQQKEDENHRIKKINWIEKMIKKLEEELKQVTDENEKAIILERIQEFKNRLENLKNGKDEYYGYNPAQINLCDMYPGDDFTLDASDELYIPDETEKELYHEESSENNKKI